MNKQHISSFLLFLLLTLIVHNNMQAMQNAKHRYDQGDSQGEVKPTQEILIAQAERLRRNIRSDTQQLAQIDQQIISFFATFHNRSHSIINIPFDSENRPLESFINDIITAAGETGTSFCLRTLHNKYNNTPIQKNC